MSERTRIKICGLRHADAVQCAIDAGTDYIGLNFIVGSPREIQIADARNLVAEICRLSEHVQPVAVFANQSKAFIDEVLESADFKIIQLHGDEDSTFVESLDNVQVFKAIPFAPQKIDAWRNAPANVAAILIDTPTQPGELTGGTGKAFDWDALANLDHTGLPPVILAGGLTPDNVAQAIQSVHPFAVDVSSGVESSRGVKDAPLIQAFCKAVKSTNSD